MAFVVVVFEDDEESEEDDGESARSSAAVTSSPTLPSPRVAARTSLPRLYSRRRARPSILGSATQEEAEEEEGEVREEEEDEEALDDDRRLSSSSSSSLAALASLSAAFLPHASRSALLLTESSDSIGLGCRTLETAGEEGETGKPTGRSAGSSGGLKVLFFFPFFPGSSFDDDPKSLALSES